MQKIMFNDNYGLTKAVLEGCKTQTRRIVNAPEEEVHYCVCAFDADIRIPFIISKYSRYKIGEEVAIAQKYSEHEYGVDWVRESINKEHAGWNNKMFVSAEEMPHRIMITNIRVERLQDISDEDCMEEGVKECSEPHIIGYPFGVPFRFFISEDKPCNRYLSPHDAYAALINKVSGKGTWKIAI